MWYLFGAACCGKFVLKAWQYIWNFWVHGGRSCVMIPAGLEVVKRLKNFNGDSCAGAASLQYMEAVP